MLKKVLILKVLISVGILAYTVHPGIGLAANLVWLWVRFD